MGVSVTDPTPNALVARRHVETFRAMTMEKVIASLRDTPVLPPGQPRAEEGAS